MEMEFMKLVNMKSKTGAPEIEFWMCLQDERLRARQNFIMNTTQNKGTERV
jgi:hypothetical protein